MIGTNLSHSNLASCMMSGMDLTGNNLSFADLSQATLTNTVLAGANLTSTKLSAAFLEGANLSMANLSGASASSADFSNANLSGANLTGAAASSACFSSADLSGANLTSVNLGADLANGLGGANLSGANLSSAVLKSANLTNASLTNANLSQADLSGATFSFSTDLTNADVTGANIKGTNAVVSKGFTAQQLYSTANYQKHDLTGIAFGGGNLAGWDFSYQDLTLDSLSNATLTNANFTGALIAGARFSRTATRPVSTSLTAQQLYSTASYQNHDLHSILITNEDLTGWDFSAQNLTNVLLNNSTLASANFSAADLRGGTGFSPVVSTTTINTILPAGNIEGLNLNAGQSLAIRDFDGMPSVPFGNIFTPIPIIINSSMSMASGSSLKISLHDANWGSTISFASGIPVTLGGELDLLLDSSADIHGLIGVPNHIFNWNSPPAPGNHFDQIVTDNRFVWDTSSLYTTGVVEIVHLFGDVDDSGYVDVADLNAVAQHWQEGSNPGDPVPGWADGDFNGDGIVNVGDLQLLANNWGVGNGGSAPSLGPMLNSLGLPDVTVPEPTWAISLFGLLIMGRRRGK